MLGPETALGVNPPGIVRVAMAAPKETDMHRFAPIAPIAPMNPHR